MLGCSYYGRKGVKQFHQVFIYDKSEKHKDRKAIGEEFYNDKGERTKTWKYKHDEQARKSEVEFKTDEGNKSKTVYNYGDNVISMHSDDWQNGAWMQSVHRTYKLNDERDRIEEISLRTLANGHSHLFIFKYNDEGCLVEEESSAGDYFNWSEYSYEFDERGNWITKTKTQHSIDKKTNKRNDAVVRIEHRSIEYYE